MILFWTDICLSVRTIQNANNWRNLTEYLFVVDDLLKRKGLRYYLFLLRFTNGLTVLQLAKVQVSWSILQQEKLFKKSKFFIVVIDERPFNLKQELAFLI